MNLKKSILYVSHYVREEKHTDYLRWILFFFVNGLITDEHEGEGEDEDAEDKNGSADMEQLFSNCVVRRVNRSFVGCSSVLGCMCCRVGTWTSSLVTDGDKRMHDDDDDGDDDDSEDTCTSGSLWTNPCMAMDVVLDDDDEEDEEDEEEYTAEDESAVCCGFMRGNGRTWSLSRKCFCKKGDITIKAASSCSHESPLVLAWRNATSCANFSHVRSMGKSCIALVPAFSSLANRR
jgi:hypothetical protein